MKFDKSKILKSSEIGQHEYCSVAWYLQRCGYKPSSDTIDKGVKAHAVLGEKISSVSDFEKISKSSLLIGVGLLLIFFILIIWLIL